MMKKISPRNLNKSKNVLRGASKKNVNSISKFQFQKQSFHGFKSNKTQKSFQSFKSSSFKSTSFLKVKPSTPHLKTSPIQVRTFKTSISPFSAAKTFEVKPTHDVERLSIDVRKHPYTLGWKTLYFQALTEYRQNVRNPNKRPIDWDNDVEALTKMKNNPELMKFEDDNLKIPEEDWEKALSGIPEETKKPILNNLNATRVKVDKILSDWKSKLPPETQNFYFGTTGQAFDYLCKIYNLPGRPTEQQLKNFDPVEQKKKDDKEVLKIKNLLKGNKWISGPSGQMFRYEVKTAHPRISERIIEDLKKEWGEAKFFTAFYEYGHPSVEAKKEAAEFLKKYKSKF